MNESLQERFPEMTPLTGAPSLEMINGIGTTIYGRRDHDSETNSYVTTQCIALLWIPIFWLKSFRVVDAPNGGWYFLGRVPLSQFSKMWNIGMLLLIVGGIGGGRWLWYTGTPEYKDGIKLSEADELAANGRVDEAATKYREVMSGKTSHAAPAEQKLASLVQTPMPDLEKALGVYRIAAELNRKSRPLVPNLFDTVWGTATGPMAEPKAALQLIDLVASQAPRPQEVFAKRLELLQKIVAADPNDLPHVTRLATALYQRGKRADARKLLEPLGEKLIGTNGAGVLGQLYSESGESEKAIQWLKPYVDANLPKVQSASNRIQPAIKAAQDRAFDMIENGSAPGIDTKSLQGMAQDEQQKIIKPFVYDVILNDPAVRAAQDDLAAANEVVPAVIDLGMAYLQKAQSQQNPDARKEELQKAEQTLLSIRSVAGDDDDYKLSLGRVYYWLGKATEGKNEFDSLLKIRERAPQMLLAVAQTLREIGSVSEARKLAEEAYTKTGDNNIKYSAAYLRAVMHIDLDDEITWLNKADPNNAEIQANLANSRGHKAQQAGDRDTAATAYREALSHYAKLPETSASLNNSALTHFALHQMTGDQAEFGRGAEKMDRAITLMPANSILLNNAGDILMESATREACGGKIDFTTLKTRASSDMLAFLYTTDAERKKLNDAVQAHPGYVRSKTYADKRLLLAPRQIDSYTTALGYLAAVKPIDDAALKALAKRVAEADLDYEQFAKDYADYASGKSDEKKLPDVLQRAKRNTETLAAARAKGGPTFALAVKWYLSARMAEILYGQTVDVDELVKLAQEAYAASKSEGSLNTLVEALQLRAHQTLQSASPQYAALAKKSSRTLASRLVYWLAAVDGPLGDAVRANADIQASQKLMIESFTASPEDSGVGLWMLCRKSHPEVAAKVVERFKKEPSFMTMQGIQAKFAPYDMTRQVWAVASQAMLGQPADMKSLATLGLPELK